MRVPQWLQFEYMSWWVKAIFVAGFVMLLALMYIAGVYQGYLQCQNILGI